MAQTNAEAQWFSLDFGLNEVILIPEYHNNMLLINQGGHPRLYRGL